MAEEEHRCQAPRLCANNCGFFGGPATQNLCSKCYRDLQLKEHHELALSQTLASASSSSSSSSSSSGSQITTSHSVSSPGLHAPRHAVDAKEDGEEKEVSARVEATAARPDRCLTCRRRVGMTGFRCRCGMTFCGSHRYPEQHGCGFDFKGMGKDQIAKANPVVKADKLHKI